MVEEGRATGWPAPRGQPSGISWLSQAGLLCPAGRPHLACLVVSSAAWAQGSASRRAQVWAGRSSEPLLSSAGLGNLHAPPFCVKHDALSAQTGRLEISLLLCFIQPPPPTLSSGLRTM